MTITYSSLGVLLTIAALVAMLTRRWRLPYTFALVIAGLALALFTKVKEPLIGDQIIYLLLPALIFETAYGMKWRGFKAVLLPAGYFAVVGVVTSAVVIGLGLVFIAGWDWRPALLLAVVVSPTDPVAVVGTLKKLGLRSGFRHMLDAESLLNDGTAAVTFQIALILALGGSVGILEGAWSFVWTVLASCGIGGIIGGILILLAGRTNDTVIELAFSTLCAYGSFLAAQNIGYSGVLATLFAGIVFGNAPGITSRGHEAVQHVWEFFAFVANSSIFLLIGYRLVKNGFLDYSVGMATAIVFSLVGRVAAVTSGAFVPFVRRVLKPGEKGMMVVGGLRGALSIALSFSIPADFQYRIQVLSGTFAVVVFSVVVQTLFINPVAKWVCKRQHRLRQAS